MPKLLDLQLSSAALALRAAVSIIAFLVTFFLLYYLPTNLSSLASSIAGPSYAPVVEELASSIISPALPDIGLAIAAFTLLGSFFRGTKVYGPLLVVNGALYLSYVYIFFHGGSLSIPIPSSLGAKVTGTLIVNLSTLMYIFSIGALLTIVKGAMMLAARK